MIKDLRRFMATLIMMLNAAFTVAATTDYSMNDTINGNQDTVQTIGGKTLQGVSVTGFARRNTEAGTIKLAKNSAVIVSNVSAQQIQKTQDTNASEVIRRVPGVSLIEDKFVMVRGLSQRYNNVWINGSAVPSSEPDTRAFSFDIIPSSQLDNLTIVKSPSAEYPADFTGGFIMINTKDIPTRNSFTVSVGGSVNDATDFNTFKYSKGSATDFLGFDGGLRTLSGGMNGTLNSIDVTGVNLSGNGFNNDWMIRSRKPLGDLKLSADIGRRFTISGRQAGFIASVNYANDYRSYTNMQNNLFGVYDKANDRSNYLHHSTDNQYNNNVRIGAMANFTILSLNGQNKYEFKNIFNQFGTSRFTEREGVSAQANLEKSAEYYYSSRTAYEGQMTGKHTFGDNVLDWSAGYAFANRNLPDRRRYLINDELESGKLGLTTGNDVNREYTYLKEHIVSFNINEKHNFYFGSFEPYVKLGAYGEYRTRDYRTRDFIYNWRTDNNTMPAGFRYMDIQSLLSNSDNYSADKLYLLEQVHWLNNYGANGQQYAGYVETLLPFGQLSILAGVRYEHNKTELISNTRDYEKSHFSNYYTYNDIFPSLNATYKFNDIHQLRFSYGRSVNRPEFRELSSSVFYDFDLASDVQGNTNLRPCYVNNVDLRYEIYPSSGEQITIAAFYKHFDSPIEWTYTVSGGTDLIYSFKNAKSANNYGLELDIRKDLSFIGLHNFSWSLNYSLIHSRVEFAKGDIYENRPMQGQSPYLINTGLFYDNPQAQLNVCILYNRIGKRIIGVGRSIGTTGSENIARVPDSYEMPRDVFDIAATKKFGNHLELKLSIRDLLSQKITYKQFADVDYDNGNNKTIHQITKQYRPGRNIGFTAVYKF
jgi:TonB-dependent receptor